MGPPSRPSPGAIGDALSPLLDDAARSLGAIDHVVVSPHLDDAALSLGATIAAASRAGERVVVLTVCAGTPRGAARGPIAAALTGPRTPAEQVALRRAEDTRALAELGAHAVWLDVLDAIYRWPERYATSFDALFGPRDPGDPLVEDTRALFAVLAAQTPSAKIWAPLGVGGHVDHVTIADGALDVIASGAFGDRIALYEELPYAARAGAVAERITALAAVHPPLVCEERAVDDAAIAQKLRACACYASQLPGLFDDDVKMRGVLGAHGERGWRVAPGR